MSYIDISADLGEGIARDHEIALFEVITSASIACGGHTGDESSMAQAIDDCLERFIRIGAHPSYPDRINFGRVSLAMPPEAVADSLTEQVNALQRVARQRGTEVSYFKPHGALYNDAAWVPSIAEAIVVAADRLELALMGLSNSLLADLADDSKVPYIKEGFIDRGYRHDGSLIPRDEEAAIITDVEDAVGQAFVLAETVDSLCIHSDTPGAVELARTVRNLLSRAGYHIGPE